MTHIQSLARGVFLGAGIALLTGTLIDRALGAWMLRHDGDGDGDDEGHSDSPDTDQDEGYFCGFHFPARA